MKQFQVQLNEAQVKLISNALGQVLELWGDFTPEQAEEIENIADMLDNLEPDVLNILDEDGLGGTHYEP